MLATFCRDCGLESASAYEAIGYAGILPLGSICRKCSFHGTLIDLRRAFPTVFSTVLVDTIAGLSPVVRLSIYSLDAALVPGRQAASEGFRNFGFDVAGIPAVAGLEHLAEFMEQRQRSAISGG